MDVDADPNYIIAIDVGIDANTGLDIDIGIHRYTSCVYVYYIHISLDIYTDMCMLTYTCMYASIAVYAYTYHTHSVHSFINAYVLQVCTRVGATSSFHSH